jgi:hypothetical protein
MSPDSQHQELDEATIRRLAQLADGSLRGPERDELEAEVALSPALGAALERQRAGMHALRGLDLQASPGLRERIAKQQTSAARPRGRRRLWVGGAIAGAVAAAALAAVLVVPSGGSNPTVVEAARLADGSATAQVAVDPENQRLLASNVGGVPFPNWSGEFGWRGGGVRSDRLQDRAARTVFYEKDGKRVAYTIVGGNGIPAPDGSRPATSNGVHLHALADRGRRVVTWWRDGRTCVLSSTDVGERELIKLASWKGDGAVPF